MTGNLFLILHCEGKNAAVSKEGLIKSGMNNSGRAVLVSGTSTQLPYGDAPVDLSSDDKDLVLEYSGNCKSILSWKS